MSIDKRRPCLLKISVLTSNKCSILQLSGSESSLSSALPGIIFSSDIQSQDVGFHSVPWLLILPVSLFVYSFCSWIFLLFNLRMKTKSFLLAVLKSLCSFFLGRPFEMFFVQIILLQSQEVGATMPGISTGISPPTSFYIFEKNLKPKIFQLRSHPDSKLHTSYKIIICFYNE